MATYEYLGYGYTDSKGMAKLAYDKDGNAVEHSYTGMGKGDLNIVASIVDATHINDRSFVSETYEVLDNIFYDSGVTGTTQTSYIPTINRIQWTVTDEGTVIKEYNTSIIYGHLFIKSDTPSFSYPLKIEFNVVAKDNTQYFNIYDTDGEARVNITKTGHHIITIDSDGVISATCDGNPVTINPQNPITGLMRLSFFISGVNNTLTFKDLKIYPI